MGNWPTAPPAGNLTVYLPVPLYFRDPAECASKILEYNASFLPGIYIPGVQVGPERMLGLEGIAETDVGWQVDAATKWIDVSSSFGVGGAPFIRRGGLPTGLEWADPIPVQGYIGYPADGSGNIYWWPPLSDVFDYTQDWFTVAGHPSIPVYGAGQAINYIWVMVFLNGGGGPTIPAGLDPMRPRRWTTGAEMLRGGEGTFPFSPEGDGGTAEVFSRDASRTPDGIGWAFHGSTDVVTKRLDQFISPVVNPTNSWERFYLRVRAYPTADTIFWRGRGSAANSSMALGINATGNLLIYSRNNVSTQTLQATSAGTIPLNTWRRTDLYLIFRRRVVPPPPPATCEEAGATGGNQGFLDVYINRALFVFGQGTTHDGSGAFTVTHNQSDLGTPTANGIEIDVDDWSNMDPGPCAAPTFQNTLDWLYGAHVQLIRPTGPGSGHAASWDDTYRTLLQNPAWRASITGLSFMSSATASARLEMNTEMDGVNVGVLDGVRQLGCLAFVAGYVNDPSDAGTNGQVGYSIGGVDTLRTVVETSTLDGYSAMRNVVSGSSAMPALSASEPMDLVHIHATDITTDNLSMFNATAQFMGSWGPEDDDDADSPGNLPMLGIHNAPFPTLVGLGRRSVLQPATVAIAARTYAGNGTGQDITINLPSVHWLYIRNTSTNRVTWWWSTMLGGHANISEFEILTNNVVRLSPQPGGTTLLQLAGNHAGGNQSGVTYQLVAFCDPMSRVLINGAWKHVGAAGFNDALLDANFVVEGAFFVLENTENTLSGNGLFYKGPGHTVVGGGSQLDLAQLTQVARFDSPGAGVIRSFGDLHGSSQSQCAYAAFRQDDGTSQFPVFVGPYTGNGAGGTRNITVALRGRRPMFALIVPMNAASWVRDPSHTGTNSSRAAGSAAGSTTAITGGGVDMIQVGTTLNVNLIVYSVFILPSPSTAFPGNNGWDADETGGLVPPGWNIPAPGPTPPSWPLTLPPEGPPPSANPGCLVTFGSGTDSGGGAGCDPNLSAGVDSGGGSGCNPTLQKGEEEAA